MRLREILTIEDTDLIESLRPAIEAVESVHKFPKLPICPVIQTRRRTEQGAYYFRGRPNTPIRIEISKFAQYPNLTLIHEIGHLLDTLVLNPLKADYGSEYDFTFDQLITEWNRTLSPMRRLLRSVRLPADRTLLHSLMRPRELWARSYTQWLVRRSGNSQLAEQLDAAREAGTYIANRKVLLQWEDPEFKSIMTLVDELMNGANLL